MTSFTVPDEALAEHAAIVGRTGSGKTYAAKGFAERFLSQNLHVVIVDPTGVWWGLRSSPDGRPTGFPVVVFGGDHADVPLTEKAGHLLAEIIVRQHLSCVVDVSGFSSAGRTRFLTDFLDTLYAKNRDPLNLILDEADTVAPQRPMQDQTMLLNRAEQVIRRGRTRGLRAILITQRPAVLNKNVLTQVGALIALKLTAPQDRDAIGAWIEGQANRDEGRALLESLPKLKRGDGWVWWPEGDVLVQTSFPPITTFDSSSTPVAGERRAAPVLASVDIAALQDQLAAPAGAASKVSAAGAAFADGLAQGKEEARIAIEALQRRVRLLETTISKAGNSAHSLGDMLFSTHPNLDRPDDVPDTATAEPGTAGSAGFSEKEGLPVAAPAVPAASAAAPGKAEMRVLAVLASRTPARVTESQWATLASMTRKGGAWQGYRNRLRAAGLVEQNDRLWGCTPAGLALAGHQPGKPQTPAELLATWRHAVGGGPGRMLDLLARCPREGLTRTQLAGALNMAEKGGAFLGYLSKLRSNELVAIHRGRIVLTEILR